MRLLSSILLLPFSLASISIPSIRHYDFLHTNSIELVLDGRIKLCIGAMNTTFTLMLEKQTGLILADTILSIHDALTGEVVEDSIVAFPYTGRLLTDGVEVGSARILFHDDPMTVPKHKLLLEGSFSDGTSLYHISGVESYRLSHRPGQDINIVSPLSRPSQHRAASMIVFSDKANSREDGSLGDHLAPKTLSGGYGCGYTPLSKPMKGKERWVEPSNDLKKRQDSSTCFSSTKKVLPMVRVARVSFTVQAVAADCAYTQHIGGPAATLSRIISDWNQASAIYESTFNIQLALTEVKIMQGCGDFLGESLPWNMPCSDSFSINDRLSSFSDWRGKKAKDPAGLWHLMTKCNTGPSVGVAWLGEVCETGVKPQNGNLISGTGVSSIVPTEWKVIAHEIGHNFGATHDCTANDCPVNCDLSNPASCTCCPCGGSCDCKGQYLMHPTDNSVLEQFSPCSVALMCAKIRSNSCFKDPKDVRLLVANVCGNGVTEGSEECDSTSPCCDQTTCRYKNNAKCDDKVDECCSSCQMKASSTICRPSDDYCTSSSKCTGSSGICPTSKTQPDGTSCRLTAITASGTTCASGTCTSRKLQCKSLINSFSFRTVDSCPGQDNQCQLRCVTQSATCISLSGNFIDGTPCVGGGQCRNGSCQGSNKLMLIAYYYQTQPQIAYGVTVGGIVVLIGLLSCCIWGWKVRGRGNLDHDKPPGIERVRKSSVSLASHSSDVDVTLRSDNRNSVRRRSVLAGRPEMLVQAPSQVNGQQSVYREDIRQDSHQQVCAAAPVSRWNPPDRADF